MKLEILSIFWGQEHFKLFKAASLRSLSWSDNRKALYEADASWSIYTDKNNFLEVEKIVDALLPEIEVTLGDATDLRKYTDATQSALCAQIKKCLGNHSRLLFAPPDTLFGDGSINGLLKAGKDEKSCVVLPHPRVLPEILKDLYHKTNAELVTLAWKNLHRSWTDAEVGHPLRNSYVGGVSWNSIGPNLYSIKHVLPTVYLADFTPQDLIYFETTGSFGSFDHLWPSELVAQGRQRYIETSDEAFAVEITDKDKNIPPIWPGDPNTFWKNHPHNEHNKNKRAIFRGE